MKKDADADIALGRGRLATPRARLGIIIPSSNRLVEPQFHHYAPPSLGVHVARARITGPHARPLRDLAAEIVAAAQMLADAKVDLIAFNCTATSMKEGPEGESYLLRVINEATGLPVVSTAGAVMEALRALALTRVTLITPYVASTNEHEIVFLRALGVEVVRDVALGMTGGDEYIQIPPQRWVEIAVAADCDAAEGCFMSCANTTQIEAIEAIESATGKPAISVNQAVLWACLRRLHAALAGQRLHATLGRLARS